MPEALSPETAAKLRALSDEIAAAHGLEDDLRERLEQRMTERARAYLRSDENMDEDDAYVLVREDLRDRRLGKRILMGLRYARAPIGVARRVAAAIVATMLASVLAAVLGLAVSTGLFVALAASLGDDAAQIAYVATFVLTVVGVPVLQVLLLRRWQRRLEEGGRSYASAKPNHSSADRPWFVRWRAGHVLAAVVLAVIGGALWPHVRYMSGARSAQIDFMGLWMAIGPVSTILSCVIWLWWLDQAPRNRWASRTAFPSWVLWQFLRYAVTLLTPNLVLFMALAGSPIQEHEFLTVLMRGTLPGGAFACHLAMLTQPLRSIPTAVRYMAGTTLVPALVAWGVYATVRHVRWRGMPQEELDFPWVR